MFLCVDGPEAVCPVAQWSRKEQSVNLLDRDWGRRHWLPFIARKQRPLSATGPIVTFTFDDFPRTAYAVGGAILKKFGLHGTFYTAYGLMNTVHCLSGEHFRLDDLHGLLADGHELASHTLNHVSSRRVSAAAFLQEAIKGRLSMKSLPGLKLSGNFAYPYGAVTAVTKRAVGKMMLSCRSTYRGVNGPVVDLNLLRANPLYGGIERLDSVRGLLRMNQERGGWLIFYTHDVRNSYSRFGCSPALLESALKLALDASMKVLTVDEVLGNEGQPSEHRAPCAVAEAAT
jgi:peptidoglycan/xylan/chitin deacetylase (PgdA/CDA1 family)